MILGRIKRMLKRSLTITMAAAVVATSVPQLSMPVMAQESAESADQDETPSQTPEATEEATPEATDEAATEEATPEATDEATPEVAEDEQGDEEANPSATPEVREAEIQQTEDLVTGTEEKGVNKALRFEVTAVTAWKEFIQKDITGFSDVKNEEGLSAELSISYDLYIPADADFTGDYYIKPVVKLNDGAEVTWKWTEGPSDQAANVTAGDFAVCEESSTLKKYTYTGKIGSGATAYKGFDSVVVAVGSSTSNYNGAMFVDNVRVLDAEGNVLAVNDFSSDSSAVELGSMEGIEPGGGETDPVDDKIIYQNDFDEKEIILEAGNEVEFAELSTGNFAIKYTTNLSESEGWTDVFQTTIILPTAYEEEITGKVNMSYDIYFPADRVTEANFGTFKAKAVIKAGSEWTWTEGGINSYTYDDLVTEGEYKKLTISQDITDVSDGITPIMAVVANMAGDVSTYAGDLYLDNLMVVACEAQKEPELTSDEVYVNNFDEKEIILEAGNEVEFAELSTGNFAIKYTTNLSESEGWTDVFQTTIILPTAYEEEITGKVNMSYDIYFPADKVTEANFGTFKAKAVIKIGSSWTWTEGGINSYTYDDLVTEGEYKKLTISQDITDVSDGITPIMAIVPNIAGDVSTYAGELYLDNLTVTAYNVSGGTEDDEEDIVVDDIFWDLNIDWWNAVDGWQYSGIKEVASEIINEKTMLVGTLDYCEDAGYSWSEAKFDYAHPEPVASMKGYNAVKMDVYYKPDAKTKGSLSVQVYCESPEFKKFTALPEGEEVTDIEELKGYYKTQVTLNYNSQDVSFEKLTLGIVGVNTDYNGKIYVANAKFTQFKADDIYVDSTITERKQSPITVAEDGKSIKTATGKTVNIASKVALVDADASEATVNLYAYLKAVGESDSVIFGHQNDTHHKAGATGEGYSTSDTEDVTGSIAGVVGLDTLSLTGNEASSWDTPEADRIANLAKITKAAAKEGALITMSCHMPNFALIDERVKAYDALTPEEKEAVQGDNNKLGYWVVGNEKQYNFSGYTPNTLTGDVVSRIMPGGDLNYLYTDYLDMIADYAVAADGVTILFRPFHENTGSWFWWGAAFCDEQAYINLYRYTVDYLKETKDVHNMLYVYGPGSEASSAAEYAARYPGDAYVDMIGYDLYHSNPTQDNEATYLANIRKQNSILSEFAAAHNKLYAITETGVANNGAALLPSKNEVKDWYMQLLNEVKDSGICYFLVWANFNDTDNFYVPFVVKKKENDILYGHEMLDEFIKFYNDDHSVFATDMNGGFKEVKGVTNTTTAADISGYITAPLSGTRVLEATDLKAKISGQATTVNFVLTSASEEIMITAQDEGEGNWKAVLTAKDLAYMGEGTGTVTLLVNGKVVSRISVIFNKAAAVVSSETVDDFETYSGSNAQLQSAWATNKDTGSDVSFELTKDADKVFDGEYALSMDIYLLSETAYVGATKNINASWEDLGNALEFCTVPEAFGQKVVVQVTSGGQVFEVYLQEYSEYLTAAAKGEAVKVTVPFEQFKGRDSKAAVFDSSKIESIGLWCNAVADSGASFPLSTSIYYDEMKIVTADDTSKVSFVVKKPGSNEEEDEEDDGVIRVEDIEDQVYTGKAIKPAVVVKDGNKVLTLNKDYSVKYKNNVNAKKKEGDKATIIVKGKGNYNDEITKNFTINKKNIEDEDVVITIPSNMKATGKEQNVSVKVKYGKLTLSASKNRDYMVQIFQGDDEIKSNKVKEGTYTIKLTGQGNYTGTVERTLKVENKILINKATVILPSKTLPYNGGNEVTFKDAIIVKVGGKEVPAENYEISYNNNVEVGKKAEVIIRAKESASYMGEVTKYFEITGDKFGTSTITIENFVASKPYTGNEVRQSVILKDKSTGDLLERDTDYTISYSNDVNAGKATVTFTGKGRYTGSIKKTYTITKVTLTKDMLKTKDGLSVQYSAAGAKLALKLQYNGVTLTEGKDYTVSYGNNKKVTDSAYATIKGKGNFTGTLNKAIYYNITQKSMNSGDITVAVSDMKWNAKTKEYKPSVTVYDNGRKLRNKTDYTVTYAKNRKEDIEAEKAFDTNGHTATITISGKGNYKLDRVVTFRIAENHIKDAKVNVDPQSYDKAGAVPEYKDLTVTFKGVSEPLKEEDYEIISVSKNTKKGKGELIIQGKGKYCGTKKVSFTIGSKSMITKVLEALGL